MRWWRQARQSMAATALHVTCADACSNTSQSATREWRRGP
ncbi:hypothetical protein AAZV13_06G150500 [Glycine max]